MPLVALALGAAVALVCAAPASAAPGTTTTLVACKFNSVSNCSPYTNGASLTFGQTVKLTATVTPTPVSGTVAFIDTGSSVYGAQSPETVGSVAVSGTSNTAVFTGVLPFLGLNSLTASYTGSPGSSSSATFNLTINVNVSNGFGTLMISELRPWGPGGTGDTYVDLYDNSVASTGQPVPLAGWRLKVVSGPDVGDVVTIPATAPTLSAKQTYLITGPAYSLTPGGDLTSADLGTDSTGEFGFQLVAPDGTSSVTDTVASIASGTNPGDNNDDPLAALVPPAANQAAQWAWTRQSFAGIPQDTFDNGSDFLLVSNSTAPVGDPLGDQVPALGSPAPQASTSPYQQVQNLKSRLLVGSPSTQQALPNRVYHAGSPGSLVIQRTITNSANSSVCGVQVRITSMSEVNGGPEPGSTQPTKVADLRLVDPAFVGNGAATAPDSGDNPTANTVQNLSPDAPANGAESGGGAGQDTTLKVPVPSTGLAAGASVSVSFTFAVDSTGWFWFGYITMAYTPGADTTCPGSGPG